MVDFLGSLSLKGLNLQFKSFNGVIFILKQLLFGIEGDLNVFEFGFEIFVEFLVFGLRLALGEEGGMSFFEVHELFLEFVFVVGKFGDFLLVVGDLLGVSVFELVELSEGILLVFVSWGELSFKFDDYLLELLDQWLLLLIFL